MKLNLTILLGLLTSGCAYNAQPFVVNNAFPVERLEGYCPSEQAPVLTDFTIISDEMQMNFPQQSFIGTPDVGQKLIGPMETIELYLGSQDNGSMGMVWLRFPDGIKDDLLNSVQDSFYFSQTDEQASVFAAGGCAGPSEFDWTFDRLADRAVISSKTINGHKIFHVLVFWKRTQDSKKNLFDYSANGDFEIMEN